MTVDGNPWDGSAAQVVPQAVERFPLFHWRPGARLLSVGSRDGASFAADWRAAEANTFHRPLTVDSLRIAADKLGVAGFAATWAESLRYPRGLDLLLAAAGDQPLIVASAGRGDPELLAALLPRVDAWLLLVAGEVGDLTRRILEGARHVEIHLGLDGAPLPDLPWSRAAAVHLVPLRAAGDPVARRDWYGAARAGLTGVAIYDEDHPHSDCACGARLVWRSGGTSRRDALTGDGRCRACGTAASILG